ncbi:MAG: D-2-hydroxyacid dehydrogenase [Phycisphaeraceae bacterium]|nr:D-2-hydroxyacid dehydrogenase [Phycisphaeraceae bacterium]
MKYLCCLVFGICAGIALGQQPTAEEFGSTRNARVAFAMPAGDQAERTQLTVLMGRLPPAQIEAFERLAPNVRFISGLNRQTALEHAGEAHGVAAHLLTPEFLEKSPKLVWVISFSAGVDRYVQLEGIDKERIVMTNSRAVHGPAIADHVFAMLLMISRDLATYARHQEQQKWSDRPDDTEFRPFALQGKTMLVVGLGGIGSEVAKRADGFGMRVIAMRRSDAPSPAFVERVGKPQDLAAMLPEADVVTICAPLTKETEKLFNAELLAKVKRGAILINIARGKIVDTDALLGALRSGVLAGACLDVTDPEPLPSSHPLWKQPRVVITPHVAADSDLTDEREWGLVQENVRRFGAGEPLLNVVDVKSGY